MKYKGAIEDDLYASWEEVSINAFKNGILKIRCPRNVIRKKILLLFLFFKLIGSPMGDPKRGRDSSNME